MADKSSNAVSFALANGSTNLAPDDQKAMLCAQATTYLIAARIANGWDPGNEQNFQNHLDAMFGTMKKLIKTW
jgi:hypothetical protein